MALAPEQENVVLRREDGRKNGFSILYDPIVDNTSLSIFAKACYMVLLRHANRKTDECFVRCDLITAKMGLKSKRGNTSTARRAITELVGAGLVEVVKRTGRSSVFRLLDIPKLPDNPAPIEQGQEDRSNRAVRPLQSSTQSAPIEQHNHRFSNQSVEQEYFFKTATADAVAGDGKPSSSPPSSKKPKKPEHPEHQACCKVVYDDFVLANPGGKLDWNKAIASHVRKLLSEMPSMTAESLKLCCQNRRATPGIKPAELPKLYLTSITNYLNGPLNEFGKTPGGMTNGPVRTSRFSSAQSKQDNSFNAIDLAGAELAQAGIGVR